MCDASKPGGGVSAKSTGTMRSRRSPENGSATASRRERVAPASAGRVLAGSTRVDRSSERNHPFGSSKKLGSSATRA